MTNKEIYTKTLSFSLLRVVWDIVAFLILGALSILGFVIAEKTMDNGLVGLLIGFIIGVVIVVIMMRFVSYNFKAGQIAMMTKGIVEGKLPDKVLREGAAIVKRRFLTVAAFYAVTKAIKGIFNELGNAITKVGEAVGGDTGSTIGSAISAVISVVVSYLCDCCLGWIFYREDVKPVRATLEGAVLFFKHGKTFAKNMGRVFGIGLLSLLAIGGAFTGIFYLIFINFPQTFAALSAEVMEVAASAEKELPAILSNQQTFTLVCAIAAGVILWIILHSVFVRPFILTGVLRNYIESGKEEVPTESSFENLDSKSKKFAKLHKELYA